MEKEFVPYKEALEVNELGFDEPCFATIDQTEFVHINGTEYPIRGAMDYRTIDLPTFSQVFRFFRDKYNICHLDLLTLLYLEQDIPYEEAEYECLKRLIEFAKENNRINKKG